MPAATAHSASQPLYHSDDFRIEESVGFLIAQVRARLLAAIDAEATAFDITAAQWMVLMHLANGYAETAGELCRCSNTDTGSMTRMLDRLADKGLIARERSDDDRRVVKLRLTAAGRALAPQLPGVACRALNQHLRGFSREEHDLLKSLLRRMLANAE